MSLKVAMNGFGRIGRCFIRLAQGRDMEFVALNVRRPAEMLAHLLKYDSVHGTWDVPVGAEKDALVVDGKKIPLINESDHAKLPWKDMDVDIMIESTGAFRKRPDAQKHLDAGAKKVMITAPADDPDATIVMGVNHSEYDKKKHHIISNASCTTNCLAPVAKVLDAEFQIQRGLMTTIHSYTLDQRLLDGSHKDLRRGRAAAVSMIPTTTGAAKAVGLVLPRLKGKLSGLAIRVPTPNVSLVDLTVDVEKKCSADDVNAAMKEASESDELKGILAYSELPLVSIDFNHTTYSSTFDAPSTFCIDNMVKTLSWYDNEWGYAARLVDLCEILL
jgi:glyceraldehyde 3-phosphate dehydrogenase